LPATTPPTGRLVLVNGVEAWLESGSGTCALSSQRYAPDVVHPDGATRIVSFTRDPWPAWEFELPDGTRVRQEILLQHGAGAAAIGWTLLAGAAATLHARLLLSGRDYHSLHHENGAFRFDADVADASIAFAPYDGVPAVIALTNGEYRHAPDWYRN